MTATSVGSSAVLQQIQSLLVRLKLARSLEVLDDLVQATGERRAVSPGDARTPAQRGAERP